MKVYRKNHKNEVMRAGRYYIGDLCYILDEKDWGEVCDLTFPFNEKHNHKDVANVELGGKFTLKNGKIISLYGTEHGDGTYHIKNMKDNNIGKLYVDSGTLGCVMIQDKSELPMGSGFKTKTFKEDFELDYTNSGEIVFKNLDGDWIAYIPTK
jgi:hypothetical protein